MTKCNSTLYQILYSENLKARDKILKIASFCEQFSLTDVFITQNDCHKVLCKLTDETDRAFNAVAKSTKHTE